MINTLKLNIIRKKNKNNIFWFGWNCVCLIHNFRSKKIPVKINNNKIKIHKQNK